MFNKEFMNDLANSLEISADNISKDYMLPGKGNWDSICFLATISIIDKHFNIIIERNDLEECKNIEELCNLISQNLSTI